MNIRERLQGTKSFDIGDSALDTRKGAWKDLFAKMERLAALEEPWTLVIKCVHYKHMMFSKKVKNLLFILSILPLNNACPNWVVFV